MIRTASILSGRWASWVTEADMNYDRIQFRENISNAAEPNPMTNVKHDVMSRYEIL